MPPNSPQIKICGGPKWEMEPDNTGSNKRKSSNGRKAVSKTVNVGSIPAFRAHLRVTTQETYET